MKILITGGASGIGYASSLVFAARGFDVYLTCHTKKEVENLEKVLKKEKNIHVFKLDITNDNDRKKVLDLDVDYLFCNAAMAMGGSLLEANMDEVRVSFEVNVFSNFALVKEVLKQMLKKKNGRVIIMSSLSPKLSLPFSGIYAASKASISTMTNCLQKELNMINKNVKVVLIEPGMYKTGFNNVLTDSKYNDGKYFQKIKDKIYKYEHLLLKIGEKDKLDTIIVQIVRAVEDTSPKHVYRAPLSQSFLAKMYNIFK